jgi:hypothetical protein
MNWYRLWLMRSRTITLGTSSENNNGARANTKGRISLPANPNSIRFLVLKVLELLVLRKTNVKDVCVQLANDGLIDNTWKPASRNKPFDGSPIRLSGAEPTA